MTTKVENAVSVGALVRAESARASGHIPPLPSEVILGSEFSFGTDSSIPCQFLADRVSCTPPDRDLTPVTDSVFSRGSPTLTTERLLSIFEGDDFGEIQRRICELPGVEESSAFAARHVDKLTELREHGGWVRCKSSWSPEERREYGRLRDGAIASVLTACKTIMQSIGYGDTGKTSVFGTAGVDSDIDINFIPPREMSETDQALFKVLFDAISAAAFGDEISRLLDTSFYLAHPATREGVDPETDRWFYMQILAASWHHPAVLEDHASAGIIEKIKARIEGASPPQKMRYILEISKAIDRAEHELETIPPTDTERRGELLQNIERMRTFRVGLFDASYLSSGTFRFVCSLDGSQQQQTGVITPIAARVSGDEGTPSFHQVITSAPASGYRKARARERTMSCIENGAMFFAHYKELLRQGVSPAEALISQSKYLLRTLASMKALLKSVIPGEGSDVDAEQLSQLHQRYAQLLKLAQGLESCKRGRLSPSVFRSWLERDLRESEGVEHAVQTFLLGDFMETFFSALKVEDRHIGLFLSKEEQAVTLAAYFNAAFETLFGHPLEDKTLKAQLTVLFNAAVDLEFPDALKQEAHTKQLEVLASADIEQSLQTLRDCLAMVRRVHIPSLGEKEKEEELTAIEGLFPE